jgi:phage-related protein
MADENHPKPLIWLGGKDHIKTPPMSQAARIEAGVLLRRVQDGEMLGMPQSRPMPSIGARCHEIRVRDENRTWRVVYRIDPELILIVAVFSKTTRATPKQDIDICKDRLKVHDENLRKARREGGR